MGVFLTGDIHGDPWRVWHFADSLGLGADDVIVLLGDVAANYFGGKRDDSVKTVLDTLGPKLLLIHGNHEMRPQRVPGYELAEWRGGRVWVQPEFPNLLFAKDGEIFELEGRSCIAIGGAYSVDKPFRLANGHGWWPDEQPDEETKAFVEKQLETHAVDAVFSHTCPYKYAPADMFLSWVDQSSVDSGTELWLDAVEEKLDYKAWYCGHWHTDRRRGKMHFLFETFEKLI